MKDKARWGKIEKQIKKLLSDNYYGEFSLRWLTSVILEDSRFRDGSKYNSIRNAVNRLEDYDIVETKTVKGNFKHRRFPKGKAPTHLRMVRLKEEGRHWGRPKGKKDSKPRCKSGYYQRWSKQGKKVTP